MLYFQSTEQQGNGWLLNTQLLLSFISVTCKCTKWQLLALCSIKQFHVLDLLMFLL